jgi:hypothetical protein
MEGERLPGKEKDNHERVRGCQERRRKIMKGERLAGKEKKKHGR